MQLSPTPCLVMWGHGYKGYVCCLNVCPCAAGCHLKQQYNEACMNALTYKKGVPFITTTSGPAEAKFHWSSLLALIRECVHWYVECNLGGSGGMLPQGKFFQIWFSEMASEAIFGDERCSQDWTMLFAQPRQATNATAIGLNYATLVWHRRHLACRRQARIFPACTSMWPLEKSWKVSKSDPAMAWATGPAPPALHLSSALKEEMTWDLLPYTKADNFWVGC